MGIFWILGVVISMTLLGLKVLGLADMSWVWVAVLLHLVMLVGGLLFLLHAGFLEVGERK